MWSYGFKLKSFVVVRDYIILLIPASLGPYLLRVAYLDKNLEQRHDETRDVCVRRRAASATPLLCATTDSSLRLSQRSMTCSWPCAANRLYYLSRVFCNCQAGVPAIAVLPSGSSTSSASPSPSPLATLHPRAIALGATTDNLSPTILSPPFLLLFPSSCPPLLLLHPPRHTVLLSPDVFSLQRVSFTIA